MRWGSKVLCFTYTEYTVDLGKLFGVTLIVFTESLKQNDNNNNDNDNNKKQKQKNA